MTKKLKHDATPAITGTIHQFYVALESCFNLVSGEKLFIEKFGDITISDSMQIEVKKYDKDLTDLHENIWKTINNWLQNAFNPIDYKELILLTTQNFSKNSSLKKWNKKTLEEKNIVLITIAEEYKNQKKKSSDTETLVNTVLNQTNSKKLKIILERFKILDSSPKENEYFNMIKEKYAKHVLSANSNDFINSLLGFIITGVDPILWTQF